MKQSRHKLSLTLAERSLKQGSSKKLSRQIAAYLLSERRVGELNSLLRDIQLAWRHEGYVEVIAKSAHPLTSPSIVEIRRQVKRLHPTAKRVVITNLIDEQLIGGVQLDWPDQQLDLSLRAKLIKLKQLTAAGKDI